MKVRKEKKIAGFTLVEVLSSVVILSVALLSIITAMQAARETQQRAQYMHIAMNATQSQIERLRSLSFKHISAPSTSIVTGLPTGNTLTVTVNKYPTSSEGRLYLVVATAAWSEGKGTRTCTSETLIAKY